MAKIIVVLLFGCLLFPSMLLAEEPPALVPQTGQTTSYASGDDGDLQTGVVWPQPRFTDQGNGAVTDNLTGLIWLKNANCFGTKTWAAALTNANTLASGACGLSDNSVAANWRLPNIVELKSLIDLQKSYPSIPGGHPFTNVQSGNYWSSSYYAGNITTIWIVNMQYGIVLNGSKTNFPYYVWPVRGGL